MEENSDYDSGCGVVPKWLGYSLRAVITNDAGEYLLLKRPPEGHFAEQWEFPGGKADAGETPDLSAERETLEETGLIVKVDKLLGAVQGEVDGNFTVDVAMAASMAEDRQIVLSGEHVDAKWVSLSGFCEFDLTQVTKAIVKLCLT